jgi:hypothetical protein
VAHRLTELDNLLLERWSDATALRDALVDLEERLESSLEAVASRLHPWLKEPGYPLFQVESKYAALSIAKASWAPEGSIRKARVTCVFGALFPYGYRHVDDDHPYLWVGAGGLSRDEREEFQARLAERLSGLPDRWINDDVSDDYPAGMYIASHGEKERVELARSEEALEAFIKAHIGKLIAIGNEVDAVLAEL